MAELKDLQERWNTLYKEILPALAKAKDPAQKSWPVCLDHCFARIVLDNAIGIDKPWTEVIKAPAVKNMSARQLEAAVQLAEDIANGKTNLVELDEKSLELRGKKSKTGTKRKSDSTNDDSRQSKSAKVQKSSGAISSYFVPSPSSRTDDNPAKDNNGNSNPAKSSSEQGTDEDTSIQLKRIQDSNITPFRKQMLTLLCQIPRGRYSTYQAMADYVSKASHKSCARAVGNAMKNNPFAPEVPCHRVLASDGSLGGFKGSWGEEGKYASLKQQLLAEEGVKFDSRGKVKGPPFRDFHS
jgi:methylated-DNA-[protein]-cysteine S-methyltransferase